MATYRAICRGKGVRLLWLKDEICMLQALDSELRQQLSANAAGSNTLGMDTRGADPAGMLPCTALCTAEL